MFENIIGQKQVVASISKSFEEGKIPPSMLFHGPQYAGKLSCGLELARILTCEEGKGDWKCPCASCRKQRLLLHPNMLLLGSRDFDAEIAASADTLTRANKNSGRFLFIRACRKLARRFDGVLWEGEDAKIRPLMPVLAEMEELLDALCRDNGTDAKPIPEKAIKKIVDLCGKLSSSIKTENIPIHHVRRASAWAHLRAGNSRKLIIIENADRMLDSSRNSLLKLLEEPPRNVHVVLLTTRKDAVIKTILSRTMPYCFSERTQEEQTEILKRIFQEDKPEFSTLRDYFLAWKAVNPSLMKTLSLKFIELLLAPPSQEPDVGLEMAELFQQRQDRTAFFTFAEEVYFRLRGMILEPGCPMERLAFVQCWTECLRETVSSVETLNLSPKNVLTSMFYRMREAL